MPDCELTVTTLPEQLAEARALYKKACADLADAKEQAQVLQQENEELRAQLDRVNFSRRNLMRALERQKKPGGSLVGVDFAATDTVVTTGDCLSVELHLGSSYSRVSISPAVDDLELLYARMMCLVSGEAHIYSIMPDGTSIAELVKSDYELTHRLPLAERRAAYRAGLEDARQMLLDAAEQHPPTVVRAALLSAASMVENMTTPDGGSI